MYFPYTCQIKKNNVKRFQINLEGGKTFFFVLACLLSPRLSLGNKLFGGNNKLKGKTCNSDPQASNDDH